MNILHQYSHQLIWECCSNDLQYFQLYLWMYLLRWQLGGDSVAGLAAKDWCGLGGAGSLLAHSAPRWCCCHHHTPILHSSHPRAAPAGALSIATEAGALGRDRGACSPPHHSCRCTGVGKRAGSPHHAGTLAHWMHRVRHELQLTIHRKQETELLADTFELHGRIRQKLHESVCCVFVFLPLT